MAACPEIRTKHGLPKAGREEVQTVFPHMPLGHDRMRFILRHFVLFLSVELVMGVLSPGESSYRLFFMVATLKNSGWSDFTLQLVLCY